MSGVEGWLAGLGVDRIVAIVSGLVAVASFVLNLRLVDRQEKRKAANLKLAFDSDVIRWSDEVIALLAAANELLCEKGVSYGDADFPVRRSAARAQLSALIDRGRLFFPNRRDTGHGAEKEAGFQGHRQAALDALVEAYAVLDRAGASPGPDTRAATDLMAQRRKFVAEVFTAVDPVRRGQAIRELAT